MYDYRGYGLSRGKSRLKAIVSDYRDIIAALNAQGYGRRNLYGMSMGGVILTNAIGPSEDYDALVLDSPLAGFPVWAVRKTTTRCATCRKTAPGSCSSSA